MLENHQTHLFVQFVALAGNFFTSLIIFIKPVLKNKQVRRQDFCCHTGDEGGVCLILVPTLFATLYGKQYVYKPKFNFLELAHTNLFSSIWKIAYQPLIWTELIIMKHISKNSKCSQTFCTLRFLILYFLTRHGLKGSYSATQADATSSRPTVPPGILPLVPPDSQISSPHILKFPKFPQIAIVQCPSNLEF